MFSNHVEHNVNVPCRRLCALPSRSERRGSESSSNAEDDDDDDAPSNGKKLSFLIGTCHPTHQNELWRLEFEEESHEVYESAVYPIHCGPIWSLEACPRDSSLVATCTGVDTQISLWKLPAMGEDPDGIPRMDLQATQVLAVEDGGMKSTLAWSPHRRHELMTVNPKSIQQWNVETGDESHHVALNFGHAASPLGMVPAVYDPTDSNVVCVAHHTDLHFYDTRQASKATSTLQQAHKNAILDVDANPNRPHTYVTSGQDGLLKFWDVRALTSTRPIQVVKGGHSHWVSSVKYNSHHDQLLVSGGTDSLVNLWRLSSISSAPILEMDDKQSATDVRVLDFECQESVYDVAWLDAWTYASVTHDGQVVVNQVPSQEKYKILL